MRDACARAARQLVRHVSTVAAIMLLAIGAITLVDVAGRYFGAPLTGGFELIQLAMVILIFTALPAVSYHREHVTVDIVQTHLPVRIKRIARGIVSIVSTVVAGFYALQLYERGVYLGQSSETTYNLQIAVAPFAYFIGLMWAVTALVFLVNAWLDFSGQDDA